MKSFLIEITATILRKKDEDGKTDLIETILDTAGQKGTGKWTTDAAMHYGVAVPTITAAVDARIVSSAKEFRVQQSARDALVTFPKTANGDLVQAVESALSASILNTYGQGFQLIFVADQEEGWSLNVGEIARIWRGGCIIRADVLGLYQRMLSGDAKAATEARSLMTPDLEKQWRTVVSMGALRGIPLPAMSATLTYFDAYRTVRLPSNLIAAQRDLFGAHTYQRIDKEGTFHTDWSL